VLELKRSVISVSMIQKKGFDITFQDGKELIMPRGYSSEKVVFFGFKESNLYGIKGQPMRAICSSIVMESIKKLAPKVE
jgi:hypothetical protein